MYIHVYIVCEIFDGCVYLHVLDTEVFHRRQSHPFDVEEANILYVAVTRAKCSLILTSTLARIMKDAKV